MPNRFIFVFVLLGIALLSGCARVPFFGNEPAEQSVTPRTPVEIVSGGLLTENGSAELGLTLYNRSSEPVWAGVAFHSPDDSDCLIVRELMPQDQGLYLCPQPDLQADVAYPVFIEVYGDVTQTERLMSLNTEFRFSEQDLAAVRQ